jgi:hypothetical protein
MRFRFPKQMWHALRRRLITAVTLLAYLATAIGFPMPASAAAPSTSHGCGQRVCCCGTAAQCRSSGCGCGRETPAEEPGCCSKKHPPKSTSTKTPEKQKSTSLRWVIGISAKKCGTGDSDWVSAQAALPPLAPTDWQPSWPYCHAVSALHEHPLVIAADQVEPPPRAEEPV